MARETMQDEDSDDDRQERRRPSYEDEDMPRRGRSSGDSEPRSKGMSLLGLFSMLLGIGSLVVSFVPCVGAVAIVGGVIALLLGIIGLMVAGKYNHGRGMSIAGVVVSVLSIGIASVWILIMGGMGKLANDMEKEREREYVAMETADAIKVNSIKMLNEYIADREAANSKYQNKLVEVTGTVLKVSKDGPSSVTVQLGDRTMIIECDFSRRTDQAANLEAGATVVIRGNVLTIYSNVNSRAGILIHLDQCIVMPNASPTDKPKTIVVDASTLATDFETKPDIAEKMYRGYTLELSGEIEMVEKKFGDLVVVYLKAGNDSGRIQCDFELKAKNPPTKADAGKTVKILGVCTGSKNDLITLKHCTLAE